MATKKVSNRAPKKAFIPQTSADFIAHPEFCLILRTCNSDMSAAHGFTWPSSGPVAAPEKWWGKGEKPHGCTLGWNPRPECGGGLHGLLWGEGSANYLNWAESAKWLIVLARKDDVVEIDSTKCKFRAGEVLFVGTRPEAVLFL